MVHGIPVNIHVHVHVHVEPHETAGYTVGPPSLSEIARHQQEQLRLAEELRKQEERMQGYYPPGGSQYPPGVNPMQSGSLVMPGAIGGGEIGGEVRECRLEYQAKETCHFVFCAAMQGYT